MSTPESQNIAIGQFVDLIANKASSGGRAVHPETAISYSARLAGSLLLRSFGLKFDTAAPGDVLLSNEANEQGPQLIGIMVGFLQSEGVQLDKSKLVGENPDYGSKPELSTVDALKILQDDAFEIMIKNRLNFEEAAQSAAVATGFIVKECAKDLKAEIGFNIAALGFIEGCKTVPPNHSESSDKQSDKKPWYKFW